MSSVWKARRSTRARSVRHDLQVLVGTVAIVASSSGNAAEALRTAGDPAARGSEAKFSAQAAATFNLDAVKKEIEAKMKEREGQ